MILRSFWILALLFVPPARSVLLSTISSLSNRILEIFTEQSRIELVRKAISKEVEGRLESTSISVGDVSARVHKLFHKFTLSKIAALRNLVENAELAAESHAYDAVYDASDAWCRDVIANVNKVDAKLSNATWTVDTSDPSKLSSGVHVTIEAYRCENPVQRDFYWTGSQGVENAFRENLRKDPSIYAQFIGTNSGLTRMFPVRRWVIEPELITIDLYDPRFRQWFVAAQSTPKDILFLIDMSGSVKGQTVHLIRMTVLHILATLNPNDYVNAIWFNSRREGVLRGCFDGFLPATTHNKKVLKDHLDAIEEKDQANLSPALNLSYEALQKGHSGGHKLVMLFTDGIEEWPTAVVEQRLLRQMEDPVRVFGFSMGYGTGEMPSLNLLACRTNATYAIVDSVSDVKRQSVSYLTKLSETLSLVAAETPFAKRPVTWSTAQMDAQGGGAMVTLSMAIVNTMENGSGVVGVAGVDIQYEQIESMLPDNEQLYAFLVDNNGIVIYHPKLKIPKKEVYTVRRTACYDKRSRSRGGNSRVQFGQTDERTLRLMGLVDSIPTLDISELEGDSEVFLDFRKAMIDRKCGDSPLLDGIREYRCKVIEGTPLTIGFVAYRGRSETLLASEVERPKLPRKALVGYYVPRRGLCGSRLDWVASTKRVGAFLEADDCTMDTRLPYALLSSLEQWTESWPDIERNATCTSNPLPANFDPLYHITSFVNTFSHITAFYPRCNFDGLKEPIELIELDRYPSRSAVDQLRVFASGVDRSPVVNAFMPIFDAQLGVRLALGGVQWSVDFLQNLFHNLTVDDPLWRHCYHREKSCQVILSDGFVAAGRGARKHLSSVDSFLFDHLIEESKIVNWYRRDSQAECSPTGRYLSSLSKAPPKAHSPFFLLYRLTQFLTSTFWIEVWLLLGSLLHEVATQPVMVGGTCQFTPIKHKELCSVEYSMYNVHITEPYRFVLINGDCSREVWIAPFPNTTMYLILSDLPCLNTTNSNAHYFGSRRIPQCERIEPMYRVRRPDVDYTRIHPLESSPVCSSMRNSMSVALLLFSWTLLLFLCLSS